MVTTITTKSSTDIIASTDFNAILGKIQNATDVLSTSQLQVNNSSVAANFAGTSVTAATGISSQTQAVIVTYNNQTYYMPLYRTKS